MPNYRINTVSRSHVQRGIEGGFTQANHGKSSTLKRLARGDLVAFYSPRTDYPDGDPLQCFTAIGRVLDDVPYQVKMTPDFHPWRRQMAFLPSQETSIRELIPELAFIPDPQRWGMPFRRGLFQIGEADFQRIARAMQAELSPK
jgi:hypothetical protein